jgi:hypothetical protein
MQEFNELGELVFGWGWKSKLARTFKINIRTARRWANGYSEPSEKVLIALRIMAGR